MNKVREESYRERFCSIEKAYEYEVLQYSKGSYGDILWRIERELLATIVKELRGTHRTVNYLDFAAGTGRIISFMENLVDTAVGIEISKAMAELAFRDIKSACIMCCDITAPDALLEGKYDLITAFRFILNAEPSLRLSALKALASRLRDDSSCLVFNNHGYAWSYRLLAYPFYIMRSIGNGMLKPNYLTHHEVMRVADQAGLKIDRIFGYGVLSGKIACMMSIDKAVRIERFATESPILSKFGAHQIYVASLK